MTTTFRWLTVCALTLPFVSACATKGFVRQGLAAQRAAVDSSLAMEQNARVSGDDAARRDVSGLRADASSVRQDVTQMQRDLAQLRQDIATLRTDFDVRITAVENGLSFAMPVTFQFDVAALSSDATPSLDRFADVARKYYGGSLVTIEGFTDPAGNAQYNVALSRRRADAVKEYLLTKGLTSGSLRAIGYGETRLVVPGAAKDRPGAELNRRVTLVIETANAAAVLAPQGGGLER
jgi:peptidoglycan-associated lipoprotein